MSSSLSASLKPKKDFTHKQIMTILIGLLLGMFLSALDQTIVSTSIYTIANDLNGLSLQAWATTAYLLTSTISTPIYGKLSDIFGRRPLYLTGLLIFLLASLLTGFVTSMEQLAFARGLQGLGAGGLLSLGLAIIADIVPLKERAKYQSYFMSVFGISSVLGPVIGGFFAGSASLLGITGWRWVFLINVPIALIALFVVWFSLHLPHTRRKQKIDWYGALTLTTGLVPLLLVAEQGRIWGWFSTQSIVCYIIGTISVSLFIFSAHKAEENALIPLRFFKIPAFRVSTILNALIGIGMFGAIAMIPLYLQLVKGLTPTNAGLLMVTFTAGIMFSSIVSGRTISKSGSYRMFPICGTAILAVTALTMGLVLKVDTALVVPGILSVFFGLGLGFCLQPLTLAMQFSVSTKDIGVATSSATFFRSLGGAIGTAVFLSVLFGSASAKIATAFEAVRTNSAFISALSNPSITENPNNKQILELITSGSTSDVSFDDTSWLHNANEILARPIREGFANSISVVMFLATILLLLAFVISWRLPKHKITERTKEEN